MLLLLSLLQLLYVLLLAPLAAGILVKIEEVLESKKGPSVFQPYYDLAKLFRKESLVPTVASPFFMVAPYITFAFYLLLTLVLPILTAFPLTFGPVVDFIGGGLVFGAAATVKKLAAIDSRNNYSHLGTSRAASVGALSEPIMLLIFIMLGVISQTNNPYVINNVLQTSGTWYGSLVHWFVTIAFFMVLIVETGKLPIESHTMGELGMIAQSMEMEYSGTELALYKWGGYMKHFLLMNVFMNVLAVPFLVPMTPSMTVLLVYPVINFVKILALLIVFALLNESVSKYRLFKIFDFVSVTFVFAFLAALVFFTTRTGGGFR
jgi:formate hydrogenlyase subunit 4